MLYIHFFLILLPHVLFFIIFNLFFSVCPILSTKKLNTSPNSTNVHNLQSTPYLNNTQFLHKNLCKTVFFNIKYGNYRKEKRGLKSPPPLVIPMFLIKLEGGLEPPTYSLRMSYSNFTLPQIIENTINLLLFNGYDSFYFFILQYKNTKKNLSATYILTYI